MAILQAILSFLLACAPPSAIFVGVAPPTERASQEECAALAAQIRSLILQFLPNPLLNDEKKWNLQKKGPGGKLRNDGRWVKVRITPRTFDQTLKLTITDMVKEKTRKTFRINIGFDAQVDLERQTWNSGIRLYSGSTSHGLNQYTPPR